MTIFGGREGVKREVENYDDAMNCAWNFELHPRKTKRRESETQQVTQSHTI